jgi:hypothetical protein
MDDNDDLFDMWMLSNMTHSSGGCLTCLALMVSPILFILSMINL